MLWSIASIIVVYFILKVTIGLSFNILMPFIGKGWYLFMAILGFLAVWVSTLFGSGTEVFSVGIMGAIAFNGMRSKSKNDHEWAKEFKSFFFTGMWFFGISSLISWVTFYGEMVRG